MNRNEFMETATGAALFLFIAAGIVALGWNEPLSYRFMSPQEIEALENPVSPSPGPTPSPTAWMTDPARRTKLDVPPHSVYSGSSSYQQRSSLDRTNSR